MATKLMLKLGRYPPHPPPPQKKSSKATLTRFRKEDVALMCDMEQMFHSFHVTPSHRDFLRFLWFENNDLDEFRMNVHLFEAVSSPAVANYSLHKTAETGRAEFGDKAANFCARTFMRMTALLRSQLFQKT